MSWNYRLVRHTQGDDSYITVHEVYYDDDGNPKAYTIDAVSPGGETLDELRDDLILYLQAFGKGVLDADDIVKKDEAT